MIGKHKSRDGSTMTYVGSSDTVGGNGQQTGYCYNTSQPGRELWDVEAKVSTSDTSMKVLGKWHLSGGAGTLAKLSGGGDLSAETMGRGKNWEPQPTSVCLETHPHALECGNDPMLVLRALWPSFRSARPRYARREEVMSIRHSYNTPNRAGPASPGLWRTRTGDSRSWPLSNSGRNRHVFSRRRW
jgi:hypothetical protein